MSELWARLMSSLSRTVIEDDLHLGTVMRLHRISQDTKRLPSRAITNVPVSAVAGASIKRCSLGHIHCVHTAHLVLQDAFDVAGSVAGSLKRKTAPARDYLASKR